MTIAAEVMLLIPMLFFISVVDIKYRKIHNFSLIMLFVLLITSCINQLDTLSFTNFAWCSLLGLLLYPLQLFGGGDLKLLAILSLFISTKLFLPVLLVMFLIGGVVAAIISLIDKLHHRDMASSVPYAVPISIAGLLGIIAS